MTTQEIKKYSQKIKLQADDILKDTTLIETLNEFGKVDIIGSYPLDIMYNPDIDIVVETKDTREKSLKAITKLLELRQFQKYEYGDFVKFPRIKRSKGFIIVLKTTVEDIKWEIEIWFLEATKEQVDQLNWISERLTTSNKEKILEAKDLRENSGQSKHQLSSYEIYNQILK